ncbi:UNVERIFIED_ORG: hypothetical protein M2328_000497 [Rhodococcus erythropolis]
MEFIRTARQAEENVAAVMRRLGYSDADVTGTGPDAGIDVVSSTALAQVKWQGAVVGRPELQRLVGARGRDTEKSLLFFTASGFSQAAVDYAEDLEIALFLYDPTGLPTPQNLLAHKIVQRMRLTGPESDVSASGDVAVPPVEPTEEEAAAEIVAIMNELSVEKFNSLNVEMRVSVQLSYWNAIVVADRLQEKFDNPKLAERYDQKFEEDYNLRIQEEQHRQAERENGYGIKPKRAFVDYSEQKIVQNRKFSNPFHPERSRRLKNRYSIETSLNPLYRTHYLLMPFKYDSAGRCFAYDPDRGTYEAFDRRYRKFIDSYVSNMEKRDGQSDAAAEVMRRRAAALRDL